MSQPRKEKPDELVDLQAVDDNQDIVQMDTGWQPSNDTEWRQVGDTIDHNAVRRAAEAVRAHELRHHPAKAVEDDEDKIPDETIRAVLRQASREGVELFYACDYQGVPWDRFVIDLADYEGRMRKDLEDRRWGRKS
jgi:hypothetical protein